MLKIKIDDAQILNLPSNRDEITIDFLKSCIAGYRIADNYALIGLCYQATLNEFTNVVNARKDLRLLTTPIFVSHGVTDSNYINSLNIKDIVTVSGSELSLGYHVNFNNNDISIGKVCNLLKENNINLITDVRGRMPVCLIEFKLIPCNDIHGNWDSNYKQTDVYSHISSVETSE